jgi:hypothetical protein
MLHEEVTGQQPATECSNLMEVYNDTFKKENDIRGRR